MKIITWLIFSLITTLSFAQSPSGCNSLNWSSNILKNTNRTFSVAQEPGANYYWVVSGSNLQIVGSKTGSSVTVRGLDCGVGTVYVTRYKDGFGACADKQDVTVTSPFCQSCSASVLSISCSPYSLNGHNSLIDLNVSVTNPFSSPATVRVQWNPANFSGLQAAGGNGLLAGNASSIMSSQFSIQQIQNGNPTGFYVPSIVRYTEISSGQVCTVYLNPLVMGCNGDPQRLAGPGSAEEATLAAPVEFVLYDLNGMEVMRGQVNGELPELVSPRAGLHVLHTILEDGTVLRKKVVLD